MVFIQKRKKASIFMFCFLFLFFLQRDRVEKVGGGEEKKKDCDQCHEEGKKSWK